MRLGWTKTKYSISYCAQKTVRIDGKNHTKIIKRFGSDKYIRETYGVTDAKAWASEQVRLMNEAEQEESAVFQVPLSVETDLELGKQRCFNGGYLFLQQIYHELGIDRICAMIRARHEFNYNLNAILSRLIYTRILYPSSKRSSFEDASRFIEQPDFELHQIYRALSILAEESDYIQSRLFRNSTEIAKRRTEVIYYDCTNFYFEIEEAEDDKQYGLSKENRPLPIVEMGLFMDRDGIPLAFCINPGNESEQLTMIPLEKKLMEKFDISKFIVCTDAGLSSSSNRCFNDYDKEEGSRAFITTQSVKKLKKCQERWMLETKGWYLFGESAEKGKKVKTYDIAELDEQEDYEKVFYKSQWVKEKVSVMIDGKPEKRELEQQLIVTYSLKYRNYLRSIRSRQIDRAMRTMESGSKSVEKKRQNDPRRFIKAAHTTECGELADKATYYIDEDAIKQEEKYDGFYAVCTNLEDGPESIVKVNKRRWEIEECFRIMKSEFEARPVYLRRKDRILAHFITCFISLIIYRYLERKLDNKYTISQILGALQEMNFLKYEGVGYQPVYTRTPLTDALHVAFGFCTSKQIVSVKNMKKICAKTKNSMV